MSGARIVVVMGVSGSGKSTIAAALADRMGWQFLDGDDFHPRENVDKMRAGVALTDIDRWPWLDHIRAELNHLVAAGRSVTLACSALKRSYRDVLRSADVPVQFVYLQAMEDRLANRIAKRSDHYFSPVLLASQFAALEEPQEDEGVGTVRATLPHQVVLDRVARQVTAAGAVDNLPETERPARRLASVEGDIR